jgi:hypothetical protein
MKTLNLKDFEAAFGEILSANIENKISNYSFEYEEFSSDDLDELMILIVSTLLDSGIVKSGEHRISDWENGWNENLQIFSKDQSNISNIIPKYFNKYGAVRFNGRLIKPLSEKFEYQSLGIILDWLFEKYIQNTEALYEFGCGPGYNLLRAREANQHANLWGLDWAKSSQEIIKKIKSSGIDSKIYGHNFDYFNPDYEFNLQENSTVLTVASLEQVGDRWNHFIDYLIEKKPKLCIHVEPIAELLDSNKFLDYLSIQYFKKRNYLDGFLDGLKQLESKGMLTIHDTKRTNVGSLFIEGYSVVVWSPN